MQLLTGEFVILALLIYISNYIRKHYAVVESILRGTVIYFPPEKTSDSRQITYVQIDDKFSQKSPYFADLELLVISLYLTVGLTIISTVLQLNPYISMGSSVSYYMILMAFAISIYGLYKQCLKSGTTHPDNLLGLLYSLILFFIFAILLNSNHEEYLDFNLHMSIELLELQINAGLKMYLPKDMKISVDYFVLSIILSMIASLAVYPMFKYLNRFVTSYADCNKASTRRIYAGILIAPLFLTTLWVKPMVKTLLPDGSDWEFYFLVFRISLVLIFCIAKICHMRTEIQSMFNSTTRIIMDTLKHPSKDNLDLCLKKCRAIATLAWPTVHQALCCTAFIGLLSLLLLTKGEISTAYPKYVTETIHFQSSSEGLDADEFLGFDTQGIDIVKNITYVKEIQRLQKIIADIVPVQGGFAENIVGISKNALIHPVFFRDFSEFLLWTTFVSWSFGTIMNFLFININPGKAKTS